MSLVLLHCRETKEEYLLQNLFGHSSLIVRSEVLLKPSEPECIEFLGRCSYCPFQSEYLVMTSLEILTLPFAPPLLMVKVTTSTHGQLIIVHSRY